MTRQEAKKTAKYLDSKGHKAISIIESYPEGKFSIFSLNRCMCERRYTSFDDAKKDCEN